MDSSSTGHTSQHTFTPFPWPHLPQLRLCRGFLGGGFSGAHPGELFNHGHGLVSQGDTAAHHIDVWEMGSRIKCGLNGLFNHFTGKVVLPILLRLLLLLLFCRCLRERKLKMSRDSSDRGRVITHRLRKPQEMDGDGTNGRKDGCDGVSDGRLRGYWKVSRRKNICVSVTFTIISRALDLPFIQSLCGSKWTVSRRNPSDVATQIE